MTGRTSTAYILVAADSEPVALAPTKSDAQALVAMRYQGAIIYARCQAWTHQDHTASDHVSIEFSSRRADA